VCISETIRFSWSVCDVHYYNKLPYIFEHLFINVSKGFFFHGMMMKKLNSLSTLRNTATSLYEVMVGVHSLSDKLLCCLSTLATKEHQFRYHRSCKCNHGQLVSIETFSDSSNVNEKTSYATFLSQFIKTLIWGLSKIFYFRSLIQQKFRGNFV
jgi:hypothetical protein